MPHSLANHHKRQQLCGIGRCSKAVRAQHDIFQWSSLAFTQITTRRAASLQSKFVPGGVRKSL
jgi:hypothetical protein